MWGNSSICMWGNSSMFMSCISVLAAGAPRSLAHCEQHMAAVTAAAMLSLISMND